MARFSPMNSYLVMEESYFIIGETKCVQTGIK